MSKFLRKEDVAKLFDEYNNVLEYFFLFYARQEHHSIGQHYEDDMKTIDYREWVRFGYAVNIIPGIVSPEDMNQIWHRLIKELEIERPDYKRSVIDFEYFKKGLIRIACLG